MFWCSNLFDVYCAYIFTCVCHFLVLNFFKIGLRVMFHYSSLWNLQKKQYSKSHLALDLTIFGLVFYVIGMLKLCFTIYDVKAPLFWQEIILEEFSWEISCFHCPFLFEKFYHVTYRRWLLYWSNLPHKFLFLFAKISLM